MRVEEIGDPRRFRAKVMQRCERAYTLVNRPEVPGDGWSLPFGSYPERRKD